MFIKYFIKYSKKLFKFIYLVVYLIIESYVIFFTYLYKHGLWDLIKVLKFLFWLFTVIGRFLIIFLLKRLINFKYFVIDCFKVLPFFFKHPDSFAEYNMTLSRVEKKKQKRRRSGFNHLCFFILISLFLVFFYDISDEYHFLLLYEFHKWW